MYKAFFYSADFTTGRSVVVKTTLLFFFVEIRPEKTLTTLRILTK